MKTFEIRVTQNLSGFYEGILEIQANSKKEAQQILSEMSLEEIDVQTDWTHGDDYTGDIKTIEFHGQLEQIF